MKKLLIVLVTMGLAIGASAQKFGHGGGYRVRGPRVIIGVGAGLSPFYPYYGPYSAFGYPYGGYGYRYSPRPSRLELQVQDIRLDYADRIKSVKMDRTLKGRERRQTIRQLKNDRDRAIVDAKRNYYYNRSSARRAPSDNGSNNNNGNNNNNNSNNNYSE
jgi:hypothetical protein